VSVERTARSFAVRVHSATAPVEATWRALEAEGHLTAFQRFTWAECIYREIAPARGADPLIVEVLDGSSGAPLAILPLVLRRDEGLRSIEFADFTVSDFNAPVMRRGEALGPREAADFWSAVRGALPLSDLLRLTKMPASISGVPNPLARLPGSDLSGGPAFGVAIGPPAETAVERIARRSAAADIRKLRRRLERRGTVRFAVAEAEQEIAALFETAVLQRRERFEALGRDNLLSRPEFRSFYAEAARRGGPEGLVAIGGLLVDDVPIATAYGLLHDGAFHLVLPTFAGGEWRNLSPGILCIMRSIEWAVDRGLSYYDFTVGDMPYKHDFGVGARPLYERYEARSPRGLGAFAVAKAKARIRRYPALAARLRRIAGRR